jgi:hypothetical protein
VLDVLANAVLWNGLDHKVATSAVAAPVTVPLMVAVLSPLTWKTTSVCPLTCGSADLLLIVIVSPVGLASAAGIAPAATRPLAATSGAITRQNLDIRICFLPAGRAP